MDCALDGDGAGRSADPGLVSAHLDLAAALAQPEADAAAGRAQALATAVQVLEAAVAPPA